MDPFEMRQVGNSPIRVTALGMGAVRAKDQAALDTVAEGYDLGIRYFDTAPLYGAGSIEVMLGKCVAEIPRDSYVLSSKVGRVLDPISPQTQTDGNVTLPAYEVVFDFSRDGILRSLEESLERLNLDRIDIALIHDPDDHYQQAINESFPTLAELRSQGVVGAIGAGMNQWQTLNRFASEGDFDCFLLAGRYTLLDQSGFDELLPLCHDKGISVILGGPYNSGVLASDLGSDTTYFYLQTPPEVLNRAKRIKTICDRYSVPLKAAALQFGLAHPTVCATIPGSSSPAEVNENVLMVGHTIPSDLWAELKSEGFIPPEAPEPSAATL